MYLLYHISTALKYIYIFQLIFIKKTTLFLAFYIKDPHNRKGFKVIVC